MSQKLKYYVPHSSWWPIFGGAALGCFALGLVHWLHNSHSAIFFLGVGSIGIATLMIGWFRDVVRESLAGLYSDQLKRTFRIGMCWFIFSEIWFFGALLAALFYARWVSGPWLGGQWGYHVSTKEVLYPAFDYAWPLLQNPNPKLFPAAKGAVEAWGLPIYNTFILLVSAGTLTMAHRYLLRMQHKIATVWLLLTVFLGMSFLYLQYLEYSHAIEELNLLLSSGIYASTFYMITGFHGLHVLIGSVFLFVIAIRTWRGHFSEHNHFAFESAAWYWHFVDTIWWAVFLFVYCL